ncbi:hypothetical protein J5N97_020387 [Dioscorea zingiberensis]|uniref:Uncharacterized protein n=1 Tax=Dioscorea zingiberensis TaxID=325984 RepID=A0A9D5CGZ7_9LILI|nr:hypothetical protein J5N97_020387 [Dioscorea zingiberensis]
MDGDQGGSTGGDASDHALVLGMDGEDLIFSEDAFAALPDFPCLSSPTASSPSPSSASNAIKTTCSSSSSSSSSASWAFMSGGGGGADLQRHAGVPDAMLLPPPPPALDPDHPLDILGDIDLLDSSLWDPSMLFSDDNLMIDEPPAYPREPEASTEDLALVFLEWLKTNRDSISPEDLRSIKLKKSTIECAARRLGGGTQGMMQLLKLILAWVQNHHLEKKKRHQRDQTPFIQLHHHLSECTPNPNPNPNPNPSFDYNPGYNYDATEHGVSWVPNSPYQIDPTSFSSYGHAVAAPPPGFHYQSTTTNQPFSPVPEFVDPSAAWQSHFATTQAPHYSVPLVPAQPPFVGCFSNQFQGSQFYQQDERLARMASATKEARKKRMARQRRISALHHHHHHHHHHNRHRLQHSQPTAPPTSPPQSDAKDWASSSSSPASNPLGSQTQQQNNQCNATSSADKRQGLKTEKNLRFLLQKVLKQSDVGSLGRIVLPKKEAEIHLPELDARDGISIAMEDIGTSKVWNMRYRGVKVRQTPQELKGSSNKSAGKTTLNQRSGLMEKGSGSRSKCSICCEAEEASTSTGAAEDVESPSMSQMDISP